MWRLVALHAVWGCGRIDFDARGDAARGLLDDGSEGVVIDASTCTVDTFETLAYTPMGAGTCSSSNAQLVCTIPGPMTADVVIKTPSRSMVGVSMTIEIVQPAMYPASAIGPGWHSPTDSIHFHVAGGELVFRDSVSAYVTAPYNVAAHRFLRLHAVDATTTRALYASDGVNYQLFAQTSAVDITDAYYDLGIDPGGSNLPGSDSVIFDNLETCASP